MMELNKNNLVNTATEDETLSYLFIGEALCMIQHLEDCLSHSIIIKIDIKQGTKKSRKEADELLTKHRTYTLGSAIKIAAKENLYTEEIQQRLKSFCEKRNWLIHKSLAHNRDDWDNNKGNFRRDLLLKIKAITKEGQNLARTLEDDMIDSLEKNGRDMTKVKEEIRKIYNE